jgi:amino acid transporter
MKKNTLTSGLMVVLVGIAFLLCGIFLDTKFNSLFWGFAGGGIIPGFILICRYFYWAQPDKSKKYVEKVENQKIDLRDERKEKFRNQSGRYAYVLGLIIVCISIIVFSVLYFLGIIQNVKILIIYLGGYATFQYIVGILIFRYLDKRY